MKKILFFLILVLPFAGFGQNIRIQQMRSSGEPAGRIIITDGNGSFEFSNNSYASDSTAVNNHLDNDNDLSPTNELIDSVRTDSVFLIIYEAGNVVGDSINLDSMFYENAKLDSVKMAGDTLQIFQGGDTLSYNVVVDFSNYWSKTEITEADTTRWGDAGTDDQTASEVPAADVGGYYDGGDVEAILQEIGADIAIAGDNWGSQVVVSNSTLSGTGVTGSELAVNTSEIPTITQMRTEISDSVATVSSGGITALTGEVTATGPGSASATVADNVIDYGNVDETLKSSTTNNTLTWDISANGIIYCTPSTGTVSFTNAQVNKSITVVLTLSGGATITWPSTAKILEGSATLGDGTFYVYIHCISSSIFTVSITKEAA